MSDILSRTPPKEGQRIRYGRDPLQFAELRFPLRSDASPLLFVVHGGFWSAAYDLNHLGHFCASLTSYGIVTCSLEYRRVGDDGGGWPGTFLDVASGIEYFRERLSSDPRVDVERSAVIGHSAGGHLALWLAAMHRLPENSQFHTNQKQRLSAVISLAGLTDLRTAWRLRLGRGAVERLMGGGPDQNPERYAQASPVELLPMGVKQVLIHGRADETVPISQSEDFLERAKAAGDQTSLLSLDGVGHFELIDPQSQAWDTVARATLRALRID